MPFPLIPLAISGISALSGALSNRKAARTSTTTPTLAPEYKTLSDLLRTRAEDRLRSSFGDFGGYEANGISNINDAFSGINQSLGNNLTSRGLATSPVAATATTNAELARGGQIAQFLNTIPQLQRQYQNEDMNNALGVLNLGRGTTSVGEGSPAGGALDNFASFLGYLHRKAALGGSNG